MVSISDIPARNTSQFGSGLLGYRPAVAQGLSRRSYRPSSHVALPGQMWLAPELRRAIRPIIRCIVSGLFSKGALPHNPVRSVRATLGTRACLDVSMAECLSQCLREIRRGIVAARATGGTGGGGGAHCDAQARCRFGRARTARWARRGAVAPVPGGTGQQRTTRSARGVPRWQRK